MNNYSTKNEQIQVLGELYEVALDDTIPKQQRPVSDMKLMDETSIELERLYTVLDYLNGRGYIHRIESDTSYITDAGIKYYEDHVEEGEKRREALVRLILGTSVGAFIGTLLGSLINYFIP